MSQESPQDGQVPHDPTQALPRVTFTKFYDEVAEQEAYKVSMDRELIQIPAVVGQTNKTGIGILFSIRPGDVVPIQDVFMMLSKAAGFVFEIIHPDDTFNSYGAAAFHHMITTDPELAAKMRAGETIENDLAKLIPLTAENAEAALEKFFNKRAEERDKAGRN